MFNPLTVGNRPIIVAVLFGLFSWKKKKTEGPAQQPAGTPGQPVPEGTPAPPKTQAEKMKEWADYERMYGRPHPDAPGWVSASAAAASAPKPKCPVDHITVSYEPFSGQYFCTKCSQRYPPDQVFQKEPELLEQERGQASNTQVSEEAPKAPVGERLELSSAPPSWSTEHGQTMTGEQYTTPVPAAQPAAPETAQPAEPAPPTATPLEASPVTSEEPVLEAAPVMPEGVNPAAGPIFSMPKPIDYSDLPPPPPPKEPPKLTEEGQG